MNEIQQKLGSKTQETRIIESYDTCICCGRTIQSSIEGLERNCALFNWFCGGEQLISPCPNYKQDKNGFFCPLDEKCQKQRQVYHKIIREKILALFTKHNSIFFRTETEILRSLLPIVEKIRIFMHENDFIEISKK